MNAKKLAASLLCAAGLLGAGLQTASADVLDRIMESKRIRISTDLGIPPAGMLSPSMEPTGADVEVGQLLAKDWGVEYELVQTTGATRIPNLQTGKADIVVSTLSVTPQRAEVIDFSVPYAVLKSVVGGNDSITLNSYDDLKGKSVAVTRGTTQDTALTPLAGKHGFNVARYDDDATLVTAAVTGQAPMVATSESLVNAINEKIGKDNFKPLYLITNFDLAIGVKKGEKALLEKVNEWVKTNLENGKLNEIHTKYYGSSLPEEMQGKK